MVQYRDSEFVRCRMQLAADWYIAKVVDLVVAPFFPTCRKLGDSLRVALTAHRNTESKPRYM